jgi:hypothetical protein
MVISGLSAFTMHVIVLVLLLSLLSATELLGSIAAVNVMVCAVNDDGAVNVKVTVCDPPFPAREGTGLFSVPMPLMSSLIAVEDTGVYPRLAATAVTVTVSPASYVPLSVVRLDTIKSGSELTVVVFVKVLFV